MSALNTSNPVVELRTFGDVRTIILDTIFQLREGTMTAATGMAIAANMKVLNDNVQVEINAAKMSIATESKAYKFGEVVAMGTRLIGGSTTQIDIAE